MSVFRYPASASLSISAIGSNGSPIPTTSILVAGESPTGTLLPLNTDAAGNLIVSPLSSSSVVTANQGTANTLGNAWPVKLTDGTNINSFTANGLKVDVQASALPTGASTSSLQTTGNTLLGTIITDMISGSQITQITGAIPAGTNNIGSITNITGTVSLPTGASTSALQTTGNTSLATIATNTTNLTVAQGSTTSGQTGQLVQGAVSTSAPTYSNAQTSPLSLTTSGALRVDTSGGSLPTGSATAANQTAVIGTVAPGTAATNSELVGGVYTSAGVLLTNGQQVAQQVDQFGNQTTVQPDSLVTGAAAQTATVNNILTVTSGTAATPTNGYKTASVQVVSTGTGGTFIFEGSNDNVNFQSIPVFNQLVTTGVPIVTAITASASQLIYVFPVTTNFVRLRIATTITGGSIQAFSRYTQAPFAPSVQQVAQNTAASLLTTATIASGTVTAVTAITNALPAGTNNIGLVGTGGSAGVSNAPVQNLYTSTPITTAAYTQLIASTTAATNYIDIFDSSGQSMILAIGGAGSEVILAYVPPGGDQIRVAIPVSTRISYKALSANATSGYLLINLWK